MTEAIFGLVGVVVGGLITAGLSYWRDRRQESRDLRSALRLIHDDFSNAATVAELSLEADAWSPVVLSLSLDEWQRSRGLVAAYLESSDWELIATAPLVIESIVDTGTPALKRAEAEADKIGAPREKPSLSAADRKMLRDAVEKLEEIEAVMDLIHSPMPGYFGLWRWARKMDKREHRLALHLSDDSEDTPSAD